jgi:ankyrin repeat protein
VRGENCKLYDASNNTYDDGKKSLFDDDSDNECDNSSDNIVDGGGQEIDSSRNYSSCSDVSSVSSSDDDGDGIIDERVIEREFEGIISNNDVFITKDGYYNDDGKYIVTKESYNEINKEVASNITEIKSNDNKENIDNTNTIINNNDTNNKTNDSNNKTNETDPNEIKKNAILEHKKKLTERLKLNKIAKKNAKKKAKKELKKLEKLKLIEEEKNRINNEDSFIDPLKDLPVLHSVSAAGDLNTLTLLNPTAEVLSVTDDLDRTPLFYSVAYGNIDVTKYILEKNPELANFVDVNGDTPLHAAMSVGSTECVSLLVKCNPNAAPNQQNNNKLTPAHLAMSADCLEVLYTSGAEMDALDINGRSPLFVACAMNRVEVAEYLINCLDENDTSLLTKDSRGDTPLHAAACNGSVDCLLLLLQYGIDPLTMNEKGFKAIELAIKNKKSSCKDILLDYQLHFCTGSDFDSMLFLSALQGHKQIQKHSKEESKKIIKNHATKNNNNKKDLINNSINNDNKDINSDSNNLISEPILIKCDSDLPKCSGGGIDIDLVPSNQSSGHSLQNLLETNPILKRNTSLFSLQKNKSIKLQKWGSWIAYEEQDPNHNAIYWYNFVTNQGQWEIPDEVVTLQSSVEHNDTYQSLTTKTSMRLKRVGSWLQYQTENGQTFYYNDQSGDFQWVNPLSEQFNPEEENPWVPFKDPKSSRIFWYNNDTKVSQWESPFDNEESKLLI